MRPSQWRRSQERALTAGSFVQVIEELLPPLAKLGTPLSGELELRGRELATAFETWRATPPEPQDRSRTINELAAWHRAARELVNPTTKA